MLLILISFAILLQATTQNGCKINITSIEDGNETLIFDSNFNFFHVNAKLFGDKALIPQNSQFLISCCDNYISSRDSVLAQKTLNGFCDDQSEINIFGERREFDDFVCTKASLDVAEITTTKCGEKAWIVNVGFKIETHNKFLTQYKVCFDRISRSVLYTSHAISKYFGFGTLPSSRNYIDDFDIYNLGVLVSTVYISESLQRNINNLLGLPENSTKYIDRNETDDFYLYATQLSNYINFFWKPQKLSTFRYINTVPSWFNDFNNPDNNWKTLQEDIFKLTTEGAFDLEIYTGTFGVATLPHEETGDDVELFLYEVDGVKAIPIPKLLWKLIYDSNEKSAVVLVTVNNPFRVEVGDIICRDISEGVKFLNWNPDNVTLGFSYACTYQDFKDVVDYAPHLVVNQIFNGIEVIACDVLIFLGVSVLSLFFK